MSLTTHVLDTARGRPAAGLAVTLLAADGTVLAERVTDEDGRVGSLPPVEAATYTLRFDTGAWFEREQRPCFYPRVEVCFRITDAGQHHHVPLLVSPFGYSSYRGS